MPCLRSLRSAALVLAAALLAPAAQAGIVFSPQSIVVSQDGTYITDTANQRDWYKFDNAQSTVGLSMDAVTAQFAGTGWSLATRAQVQGLQSQFGWTADTLYSSANANFGLTTAMGAYLGFTTSYFVHVDQFAESGQIIQAMTSDAGSAEINGVWHSFYNSTMSMTSAYLDYDFFFGDYVNGEYSYQDAAEGETGVGAWLSRAHVDGTGGGGGAAPDCGRQAPCVTELPEPASCALVAVALCGLGFAQRRRAR